MTTRDVTMISFFRDLTTEQACHAGGKGRALAQLHRAGHPVPDGFIVLSTAFQGDGLAPAAWEQVRAAVAQLRAGEPHCRFAVRSSAFGEDSAQASFAGAFETVLDVRDDDGLRRAIEMVRRSRHEDRVQAYARAHGLETACEVAVVVQQMVAAEFSGVLFSADPVTGSHMAVVGNYVRGLGEKLVAGETTGLSFTLRRPSGAYSGPPELRRLAPQLYRLAMQLERELGAPQDIEWAIAGGRLALLQARPITTLRAHDPQTGEWNDSLSGDYLWTNTNVAEAVPDVMTPCTWSALQMLTDEMMPPSVFRRHPFLGNVAGRFYVNLSALASLLAVFGVGRRRFCEMNEEVFGRIPDDLEIPLVPFSRWSLLPDLVPEGARLAWRGRAQGKRLPAFVTAAPAHCEALHRQIGAASAAAALLALWRDDLEPFYRDCLRMVPASGTGHDGALRRDLGKLVDAGDVEVLLSGASAGAEPLASLGPLVGLAQLARGEIDRATYARRHGHRGPHELELSHPRPAEDPEWIEQQLAGLSKSPFDAAALLARSRAAHTATWQRFQQRYPRKAAAVHRRIERTTTAARNREAVRSELIRIFGVLRAFVQRAGQLTGQGEALFFLSLSELLAVLRGDDAALALVPARQAIHARYCALPSYPALIRGRFDPFQWAADPRRRTDVFDAQGGGAPAGNAIRGFAGASGIVEGRARVIATVEEGDLLEAGEILVTMAANIGWAPLFPRAAAIVTDVGAPLSHATIVARELGIPAVVGCGNATMRLRSGDRVRVNGGLGTVEIIEAGAPGEPMA